MNLTCRIESLHELHSIFSKFSMDDHDPRSTGLRNAVENTISVNPWFTIENQVNAIRNLGELLDKEKLNKWIAPYRESFNQERTDKTIAVVMAGNIPLVGFLDFLCVLITGYRICVRLSGDDPHLLPAIADILTENSPEWKTRIEFTDKKLHQFDAIIATGSDNSSRYFEFYFGNYPHIIRHHRNSIAILKGSESRNDLKGIASDLMSYFGLGCRNISKLYVPVNYDFRNLIEELSVYNYYLDHHKYRNNYDYNRSMFLINQLHFMDAGSVLLIRSKEISSRIAVIHYEEYENPGMVIADIETFKDSIQCIVSRSSYGSNTVAPGNTQKPDLTDYPDQVNILDFLLKI